MSHTSGPWEWSDSGNPEDVGDWVIPGTTEIRTPKNATRAMQLYSPGEQVAVLTACEWDDGNGNPNGLVPGPEDVALLRATPDLFRALTDMTPKLIDGEDEMEDCACVSVLIPVYQLRAARAALAKAVEGVET